MKTDASDIRDLTDDEMSAIAGGALGAQRDDSLTKVPPKLVGELLQALNRAY